VNSGWPVPPAIAEHARRFAASGAEPAAPRRAATVVLLRSAVGSPFQLYAIRRAPTMAFAAGMYAFPGGTVDPHDEAVHVAWAGPGAAEWAARLGLPEPAARAVICAAVREVFEECGVLLAGPGPEAVVGDVSGPEWEAARRALLGRELSLADLLAERGLTLRSDLLAPWSRWLTPEFEPRRYDTYFFLADLPAEQRTRDVGGEADHALWITAREALALPMLPPTAYTLRQLTRYPGKESALAAGGDHDLTRAVTPRIEGDRFVLD
jgi:8-oxo-dGTP pyrophosphatase MutT (NUDIX family)